MRRLWDGLIINLVEKEEPRPLGALLQAQTMTSPESENQGFLIVIYWKAVKLSIQICDNHSIKDISCTIGTLTLSGLVQADPKKAQLNLQEIRQSRGSQPQLHIEMTGASVWSSGIEKAPGRFQRAGKMEQHWLDTWDLHSARCARWYALVVVLDGPAQAPTLPSSPVCQCVVLV